VITEILREHEAGNGFTMTTPNAKRAFDMAEKMAFSGKNYSIKLGKEPSKNWVLVVTEVFGFCDCNQGRLPCTCRSVQS
jgi:hypothetical protein